MARIRGMKSRLNEGLKVDHIEIHDMDDGCGCGEKFHLLLVSSDFEGVGLLERQQKVNDILSEQIAQIHSLEMKTWTPKQWESKQATYVGPKG